MLYSKKLTTNKSLEIELIKSDRDNLEITTSFTTKRDHAGLRFNIKLLKWWFSFDIIDNRHWNYDANEWETEANIQQRYENAMKLKKEKEDKEYYIGIDTYY
jgi:hypothetical protein